jgi:ABC-2 type transport system ATP-binding protein
MKTLTFLKDIEEVFHIDKNIFDSRLQFLAHSLNCESLLTRSFHGLSSGEKKKIMIIQALLHNPSLLIMDEPTENMDPESRTQFYKLIAEEHKKGTTIFVSTHQLDEISKYATDVVVIKNGQIKLQTSFKKEMDLYKIYESN